MKSTMLHNWEVKEVHVNQGTLSSQTWQNIANRIPTENSRHKFDVVNQATEILGRNHHWNPHHEKHSSSSVQVQQQRGSENTC